jgi:hypothetical protein
MRYIKKFKRRGIKHQILEMELKSENRLNSQEYEKTYTGIRTSEQIIRSCR